MPRHDYPDTQEITQNDDPAFSIAQSLKAVRETARKKFEAKVTAAYARLDEQACIDKLEERLFDQMDKVSKAMLGIDDSWSEIEIKEGLLRKTLEPVLTRLMDEKVMPQFEAQIAKILETKAINTAINKAIKRRVESAIYALETHRTDATNRLDKILETEVSRIIDEYSR